MYFNVENSEDGTVDKYKAVLHEKTGYYYQIVTEIVEEIEKTEEILIARQPWKPNPDGTTSAWVDEQDLVNWFLNFTKRN